MAKETPEGWNVRRHATEHADESVTARLISSQAEDKRTLFIEQGDSESAAKALNGLAKYAKELGIKINRFAVWVADAGKRTTHFSSKEIKALAEKVEEGDLHFHFSKRGCLVLSETAWSPTRKKAKRKVSANATKAEKAAAGSW